MKTSFCNTSKLVIFFLLTVVPLAAESLTVTQSGLKYMDLETGTGPVAESGKIAVMQFTAWLDDNGTKGKKIFDSRDRGGPVTFKLGTDKVMEGWNIGVAGMRVGGKRRLMVPSHLGYGNKGAEDIIPQNANLIFEIELIEVK